VTQELSEMLAVGRRDIWVAKLDYLEGETAYNDVAIQIGFSGVLKTN
jgi:hypothetical protein